MRTRFDQLPRFRDCRNLNAIEKPLRVLASDPDRICSRNLSTMYPEQFAKLYISLGPGRRWLNDSAPAWPRRQSHPWNVHASIQAIQIAERVHGADAYWRGRFAHSKTRNCGRRRDPGKGFDRRLQNVQGDTTQLGEKQFAQGGAIVDIQPLGRCDECADVCPPRQQSRLQKEVQVQTRERARLDP